jgi:hypothetical protein
MLMSCCIDAEFEELGTCVGICRILYLSYYTTGIDAATTTFIYWKIYPLIFNAVRLPHMLF